MEIVLMGRVNKKNKGFTLIWLLILVAITLILVLMSIPDFRKGGSSARQKSCFSNIRMINGAIEMYNMDSNKLIHEINDNVLESLVKEKYLRINPECPEKMNKGKYLSIGDLTNDGVIYCEYHGTLDDFKIRPGMTFSEYKAEKQQIKIKAEREKLKRNIIFYVGVILIIILTILIIRDVVKKQKIR